MGAFEGAESGDAAQTGRSDVVADDAEGAYGVVITHATKYVVIVVSGNVNECG
jgi:hypothetical protein